jgi:hypothetical protein
VPKVVSHKAASLPYSDNSGIRQAVVRIKSRQTLEKLDKNGDPVEGPAKPQDKTEYIVVQLRRWKGKDEDWIVWGTVSESDWKKVIVEQ